MPRDLEKILYVEDDADIRAIATLALRSIGGFEVCVCASGPEALAAVEAFTPDLALLDVMMPGMDGITTLQALRRLAVMRDVPVVFMTAKVQPTEIEQFKVQGVFDVIAKPFDPMTLGQQLRDIWGRHAA